MDQDRPHLPARPRHPTRAVRDERRRQASAGGDPVSRAADIAAAGRLRDAAALLHEAQRSDDPSIVGRAAFELYRVLAAQEERGAALKALRQADRIADPVRLPHVKLNIGLAWQREGDTSRAHAAYSGVLEGLSSPFARAYLEPTTRSALALAAYRLGRLAYNAKDDQAAHRFWQCAADAGDEDVSPRAALELVINLRRRLWPAEVEELLREALDYNHPDASPRAALELGRALRHRRADMAVIAYELAISSRHPRVCAQAQPELDRLRAERRDLQPSPSHVTVEPEEAGDRVRVLIVGAGTGGEYLRQCLDGERYAILGFVDDAPGLTEVSSIPVLGGLESLPELLAPGAPSRPDWVYFAIPTAPNSKRREVMLACAAAKVPLKNLPSMHELVRGRNLRLQLRDVNVEETIGTREVHVDREAHTWLRHKSVLVTGAAGSLGAELCRRLAHARVSHLVLVDRAETQLNKLSEELADHRDFNRAFPVLADCNDKHRIEELLDLHQTEVVFHLAGYRHEGLTDENLVEVVRNNVLATAAVSCAAALHGVDRFVLVSSSDAVEPTTNFGRTKALAEAIVEFAAAERLIKTSFLSVRVGPVFRSPVGAVTRIEEQTKLGGPIQLPSSTEELRLMTTHRAAELVLHAARLGHRGDLYVTNSGEAVKLVDLAKDCVRLKGGEPGRDIDIEIGNVPSWSSDLVGGDERSFTDEHLHGAELLRVARQPWASSEFGRVRTLLRDAAREVDGQTRTTMLSEATQRLGHVLAVLGMALKDREVAKTQEALRAATSDLTLPDELERWYRRRLDPSPSRAAGGADDYAVDA